MTETERVRRQKISRAMKGRTSPMKGRAQTSQAREAIAAARRGKHLSPASRLKVSLARRGANHWAWKGGISPLNKRIRATAEYISWRTAIFHRDDYICQQCDQRGGRLQADHIKPFAYFPHLRFELSNGRTLCVPCHRKTDTWGQKARNLYQTQLAALWQKALKESWKPHRYSLSDWKKEASYLQSKLDALHI